MALPLTFNGTLRAFGNVMPIRVYDVRGAYVNGVWEWGEDEVRPNGINGIVLAMDLQTMNFYQQGNASGGGLTIHTQDVLYFTNPIASVAEVVNMQSYLILRDIRFRVVGDALTCNPYTLIGNMNFSTYHCLRDIQ
jgi:hypothetical protein